MAAGRPRVAASQGALQAGQAMRGPIHSAPMALFAAPINPSDARDANEAPRQYRSPNTESFSRSALDKAKQLSIRSDYYGLSKYFLGIKKDPQKQQVAVALLDLWVTKGGGALNRAGLFISLLDPTGEYHEWFADHLYEKDVNVLGRYIHQLKLSDATLEGLVQKLFETDPDILLRHINSFIPDKDTRTTMLPLLIEKAPATFFNCCEHLKLSEQALHAYKEKYYLKAPREFAKRYVI